MNSFFSTRMIQHISNFWDIVQIQRSSPMYLFNMHTEWYILVKNDPNIPHSVTGGQSHADVSTVFRAEMNSESFSNKPLSCTRSVSSFTATLSGTLEIRQRLAMLLLFNEPFLSSGSVTSTLNSEVHDSLSEMKHQLMTEPVWVWCWWWVWG